VDGIAGPVWKGHEMKLVEGWQNAWRWFSVWCLTLSGAAPAAWLAVPDEMRRQVPAEWLAVAAVVIAIAGVFGRLVDQEQ